ncbi:hypothetical protein SCB49_04070 [unidentified eubacterium SCB49]|nr:hypothetical protein SCB49_04070 [unidentified eubacterium SCB49]
MCTVTFIKKSDTSFVLTSSRDEAPGRDTIAPKVYDENGVKCLFPKDAVAGGTWVGVSGRKRLICLLNGGFRAHKPKASYRMSRGVVVKNLLVAEDLSVEVDTFNFNDIEPFTVIAVEYGVSIKLFELVWDGVKIHFSEKPLISTIWSSSLLYASEIKQKREQWFSQFLKREHISEEKILGFHKTAGEGDLHVDLVMNREFVHTKSITQVVGSSGDVRMRYEDLQVDEISEATL